MLPRHYRVVAVACLVLAGGAVSHAQENPPAGEWIAPEAIAVLEISQPKALLDAALDSTISQAVKASPAYRDWISQPDFQQLFAAVDFFEASLDTDWRTGLGKLLGGGVTLAICPDETALMLVDSEDEKMLSQMHEMTLGIARGQAAKRGEPERVASGDHRGVQAWTFAKNEAHAILGNRLVIANNPEALKAVIDLRDAGAKRSLASLASYQAAGQAVGEGAAARLFVNLDAVKRHLPFEKALAENTNLGAAFLFGGMAEAARGSSWMAMGLRVDQGRLALEVVLDGGTPEAASPLAFAVPATEGEGALPVLTVPRRIAGLSLYRDLYAFYAAKDELFPERTSGLIFFENMMGIFFTGRELTEEVLAETHPEIRVVVAGQQYDPEIGTPAVQLPAFAAVFRLRDAAKFSGVVEEAWQKAVGLINFTRGQEALPGLIIDRPVHADVKFTTAYFAPPEEEGGRDIHQRFNFRPSLAVVDDSLILSSTEGLTIDLIDALKAEKDRAAQSMGGTHSVLAVDAPRLAALLRANQEGLISGNMIKKGQTRQQAENELQVLLTLLETLPEARLEMGTRGGHPQATLELGGR